MTECRFVPEDLEFGIPNNSKPSHLDVSRDVSGISFSFFVLSLVVYDLADRAQRCYV